jgi:hypothetical protein
MPVVVEIVRDPGKVDWTVDRSPWPAKKQLEVHGLARLLPESCRLLVHKRALPRRAARDSKGRVCIFDFFNGGL